MAIKLTPQQDIPDQNIQLDAARANLGQVQIHLSRKADTWLNWVVVILVATALIALGMWGYQYTLDQEIAALKAGLVNMESQRDVELEQNFADLKTGIEVLKRLLDDRVYSSQIFVMLEELTLPQVRFTGLDADLEQATLDLHTEALDYSTLARQIYTFEEDGRVEAVSLSAIQLGDGGRVTSDILIELDTAAFSLP